jgi:hypothetical protein
MVGNFIYDPCFASSTYGATAAACPLYFPTSPVLRITLTGKPPRALPNSAGDPTRYPPWAVQIAGGKWCTQITGASGLVAGLPIRYSCKGGGLLLGNPRRSQPTWTIFYAPNYKSRQFKPIAIESAWW